MKSVEERTTELQQRQERFTTKRNQIEKEISRVLGVEVLPLQFLLIRSLVSEFERYEKAIQNIEEDLQELKQVVTA